MAKALFRRALSLRHTLSRSSTEALVSTSISSILRTQQSAFPPLHLPALNTISPSWSFRNVNNGSVKLVISQGKPKFEIYDVDPPKTHKWMPKKQFKLKLKREKQKRKAANRNSPRHLGITRKQKFTNAGERAELRLEKARIKEALLIERLKRYEVPKVQGPMVEPHKLTGEERFYMKKVAQKSSNYVPVGRRGIIGGVILNMHLHWKKHETVKVICKPCKAGQVHQYAQEIARLSGGMPIQIIGNDTIIFYRGKNYMQPDVMMPISTLSKKKAMEKYKYEQSLESVRQFISFAEKEMELYQHISLCGDPNSRNPLSILDNSDQNTKESRKLGMVGNENFDTITNSLSTDLSEADADSTEQWLSETEDSEVEDLSTSESDAENDMLKLSDSDNEESSPTMEQSSSSSFCSSPSSCHSKLDSDNQDLRSGNYRC